MASYAYPNNPTAVPNPEQQSYSSYGQAPAAASYGGYSNQTDSQWNQSSAPFVQSPANFPSLNPPNAYAGNQPQTNFPTSGDFNNSAPSYDSGFNYQMKKNDYGQKGGNFNFRGNNNRNSGPGFNKGGPRGNYGAPSGMEEQQDTIFVSGLSENTTESELKDYFGAIGLIKMDKKTRKPKIWVYKDKETGKPKGECTITYDDPPTAGSAISWFNGKEFNGTVLKVELAQRKNNYLAGAGGSGAGNRPQFGNRGGGGGGNRDFDKKGGNERSNAGGGGPPREGDWVCSSCENNNFAWRDSCNRCKAMKPNSAGGNSSNYGSEKRGGNLPYDRRSGGNQTNGSRDRNDRGSFGGPRNNNRNQDRSFGGRDQRGGRNGGGPMRDQRGDNNRRSGPY